MADGMGWKESDVMDWCVSLTEGYTHVCPRTRGTAERAYGLSTPCSWPSTKTHEPGSYDAHFYLPRQNKHLVYITRAIKNLNLAVSKH